MEMYNCSVYVPETSIFSTNIELLKILDYCMHSFNFLFGFPTHAYVLWLIIRGTGCGVASEFFNLNLCICEAVTCLTIFVYMLEHWFPSFNTLKYFMLGLGITGRPLFQCLICVERYLAVVHPVTFLKSKPLRYRLICCSVAWIIILGSCLSCMLNIITCNFYVYVCCFSVQFLLFLCIQLFCLVAVLRALKQSGPGDRRREEENHMKRRAFHLILITTVSTTVIYVPFAVAGFFFILTHQYFQEPFTFGFLCYMLAGFVQPLLYLKRVGKLSCVHQCVFPQCWHVFSIVLNWGFSKC